jgi:hypothetical protein
VSVECATAPRADHDAGQVHGYCSGRRIHAEAHLTQHNARAGGICLVEEWRGLHPQSSARTNG